MGAARGVLVGFVSVVLLAAATGEPKPDSQAWRTVERIVDGDTVVLDGSEKVRLIGVDTAEMTDGRPEVRGFALAAKAYLDGLLHGRKVRLEYDWQKQDRYGRTLAYLHLPDGTFVNRKLIKAGYGHAYLKYPFKHSADFKDIEAEAQKTKRGLWGVGMYASSAQSGGRGGDVKHDRLPKGALSPHKFAPSRRPGQAKAQIRAVASRGQHTEAEFRAMAVSLASKYGSPSVLVQFFDDKSALDRWDGSGTLRESDWPHWLCRITVETDANGRRYAATFALDAKTGRERADVLRGERR